MCYSRYTSTESGELSIPRGDKIGVCVWVGGGVPTLHPRAPPPLNTPLHACTYVTVRSVGNNYFPPKFRPLKGPPLHQNHTHGKCLHHLLGWEAATWEGWGGAGWAWQVGRPPALVAMPYPAQVSAGHSTPPLWQGEWDHEPQTVSNILYSTYFWQTCFKVKGEAHTHYI